MKKTVFLFLLMCSFYWVNAQDTPRVEVTSEDVNIITGGSGGAYYNNREIATKQDLQSSDPAMLARASFEKIDISADGYTYLSAQSVHGMRGIVNLNDAENLIVIPEDGYYNIDIGPIGLNNFAQLEGMLIAITPESPDGVIVHLQSMEAEGNTYFGFRRLLYLKAGNILKFGLSSSVETDLVNFNELTDNNGLIIRKI